MVYEFQKHHRTDAVIETQPRRWRRSDDASSRSIRYSKGGAVATRTQRNRTATRHPRRREQLVDQAEAGRRSRVVQCSRALRPASAAATLATAKSLRLDRRGVASINGLPRSPSAAPERVRGDALFDAVAASTREWTSNGTGRSRRSSSRRRRAFTSSPSGGSTGFLPEGCP